MKRWNVTQMLETGSKLFAKIHKRKYHAHHNHEIHFMAREIDEWLPNGIQSIASGSYSPRCLKRYYFPDEMVDQLHLSDRIFQHVMLKQLKPTFKYVMNPNCYHLDGPTGVKYATKRIRQALQEDKPRYLIRADIKSFYKSIPHHKLIQDIKKYYDDPKLVAMLENIITNPIDAPYGYKNPVHGIALRGPLSQFFSGIYLKPLDDAFDNMGVTYLRYQDDILILCKTKRQLNRCRRRMMEILHERYLRLSRTKSRMGAIDSGFHFLGIDYLPTQTGDKISVTHANDDVISPPINAYYLSECGGGKTIINHQLDEALCIVLHPRTLRKARENIKWMVADQVSPAKIRNYFSRWTRWWVKASTTWNFKELAEQFINSCWDGVSAAIAADVLHRLTELDTRGTSDDSARAA
jgi:RNA-directed DNA polymerase